MQFGHKHANRHTKIMQVGHKYAHDYVIYEIYQVKSVLHVNAQHLGVSL
jgi:hypothetical protein